MQEHLNFDNNIIFINIQLKMAVLVTLRSVEPVK